MLEWQRSEQMLNRMQHWQRQRCCISFSDSEAKIVNLRAADPNHNHNPNHNPNPSDRGSNSGEGCSTGSGKGGGGITLQS